MDGETFQLTQPDIPEKVLGELERLTGEKKWRAICYQCSENIKYLSAIRPKVQDIDGFWLFTLLSHDLFRKLVSSQADQHALSFLTDVELKQDEKDPRPYEIVFHFKENPYFSNSSLSKKYALREGVDPAPADGSVTPEMRDFDVTDLQPSATTIEWKSDEKNLVKKFPRAAAEDSDGGFEGDFGSFFHWFTEGPDIFGIGDSLLDDVLPEAVDYFTGKAEVMSDDEGDDEDELDEETGDEDEEIDLEEDEEPQRKRRKA